MRQNIQQKLYAAIHEHYFDVSSLFIEIWLLNFSFQTIVAFQDSLCESGMPQLSTTLP
jgi:hypothetical protein